MKKYTVKELAQLLDEYTIGVTFSEELSSWSNHEMFYTRQELVTKYGERTITWITFDSSAYDTYQVIELDGDRE